MPKVNKGQQKKALKDLRDKHPGEAHAVVRLTNAVAAAEQTVEGRTEAVRQCQIDTLRELEGAPFSVLKAGVQMIADNIDVIESLVEDGVQ